MTNSENSNKLTKRMMHTISGKNRATKLPISFYVFDNGKLKDHIISAFIKEEVLTLDVISKETINIDGNVYSLYATNEVMYLLRSKEAETIKCVLSCQRLMDNSFIAVAKKAYKQDVANINYDVRKAN